MDHNISFQDVKVLLVDDDEEDYYLVDRYFDKITNSPFRLNWVASSDEAIAAIKNNEYDIYLIDYIIDQRTGLNILEEVNASERSEPFILLTGIRDEGVANESLQYAASDYLLKRNLTSDQLARALYYALGRKEQERIRMQKLVELNETKDEFISIASHQLRTPATVVKQYLAMILDGMAGDISDTQRDFIKRAYNSNENQLTIVNDLLKVAQIDAGRIELNQKRINLTKLVKERIMFIEPLFAERDQTIILKDGTDYFVYADDNMLKMIMDNLIDNASKYSPSHSQTTVVITRTAKTVVIEVKDEGVGVDEPAKLFQKFSRIDNSLSNKVGGTGLGLYWAKEIAQLHKGDLKYSANTPRGSIFCLELPRIDVK